MEPQQLVSVRGTARVFLGVIVRTDLHRVSAFLEPLDGPLGVVDF